MFAFSGRAHPWKMNRWRLQTSMALGSRSVRNFRCLDMCQEVIGSKVRISGSVIPPYYSPFISRLFHPSTNNLDCWTWNGWVSGTFSSHKNEAKVFGSILSGLWPGVDGLEGPSGFWYLDLYESKSLESVCEECYWRRLKWVQFDLVYQVENWRI